jgi:actin-like protein 6A
VQKRVPTAEPGLEPKSILRDDRIPHTSASWRLWAENNLLETWREACGEVIPTSRFDFSTARDLPQMLYEFPDGYCGNFGEERYRFNEILFDPKNYFDQVS